MDRELFRDVSRLLEPMRRKLKLVASRAVIELVKDGLGVQSVQVSALANETADGEHMQPGGLTHVPLAGAEGVYLSIGGERGNGVVICVSDRRFRPKGLEVGETALYNEGAAQSVVKISQLGDVEVTLAPGRALSVAGGTQSVVRADDFFTALSTWISALDTFVKIPAPTPQDTTAYTTASGVFTALFTALKSTVIKGS